MKLLRKPGIALFAALLSCAAGQRTVREGKSLEAGSQRCPVGADEPSSLYGWTGTYVCPDLPIDGVNSCVARAKNEGDCAWIRMVHEGAPVYSRVEYDTASDMTPGRARSPESRWVRGIQGIEHTILDLCSPFAPANLYNGFEHCQVIYDGDPLRVWSTTCTTNPAYQQIASNAGLEKPACPDDGPPDPS